VLYHDHPDGLQFSCSGIALDALTTEEMEQLRERALLYRSIRFAAVTRDSWSQNADGVWTREIARGEIDHVAVTRTPAYPATSCDVDWFA
jgi:hypothetical protein